MKCLLVKTPIFKRNCFWGFAQFMKGKKYLRSKIYMVWWMNVTSTLWTQWDKMLNLYVEFYVDFDRSLSQGRVTFATFLSSRYDFSVRLLGTQFISAGRWLEIDVSRMVLRIMLCWRFDHFAAKITWGRAFHWRFRTPERRPKSQWLSKLWILQPRLKQLAILHILGDRLWNCLTLEIWFWTWKWKCLFTFLSKAVS